MRYITTAVGAAAILAPAAAANAAVLPGTSYDQAANPNSLYTNELLIDASDTAWGRGLTGKGIDVAIIDTGVTPVQGLNSPGKIIDGPDLSFDSPNTTRRYRDFYGHGTHLAGIVAANDAPSAYPSDYPNHPERLTGVAPDARIVNMKVGDSNGVVDVTQVIAALNWLTQHKNDPGMNIRVVVLAYGTDSTQSYKVSPLALAVEQAWKSGLVVLAASGHRGEVGLDLPASDPYVIAVGASDTRNTFDITDDNVPSFSSSGRGGTDRAPDVVAPGVSIPSLRVDSCELDKKYGSTARSQFFSSSGRRSRRTKSKRSSKTAFPLPVKTRRTRAAVALTLTRP
jgi:serine protease AprX